MIKNKKADAVKEIVDDMALDLQACRNVALTLQKENDNFYEYLSKEWGYSKGLIIDVANNGSANPHKEYIQEEKANG